MSADTPANTVAPMSFGGLGRRLPGWLRQIGQVFMIAVLGVGSYLIISHFLLQTVSIVGRSMSPTLQDSERYLLNRWIVHVRAPQYREIVVLRDPIDTGYSVKRIIGVPGDTIVIARGGVLLNGKPLPEDYLPRGTVTFSETPVAQEVFTCGKEEFFVLGDNRRESMDSRAYGPIRRRDILGVIVR